MDAEYEASLRTSESPSPLCRTLYHHYSLMNAYHRSCSLDRRNQWMSQAGGNIKLVSVLCFREALTFPAYGLPR